MANSPVKTPVGGVKNQIFLESLFKANPTKDNSKPKRAKNMYDKENKPSKLKLQRQSEEDNIIQNIRNLFKLERENEAI